MGKALLPLPASAALFEAGKVKRNGLTKVFPLINLASAAAKAAFRLDCWNLSAASRVLQNN